MKYAFTIVAMLSVTLSAQAFEPSMSLTVETPLTPVFNGTTNLPGGANLMLTLTRPDVLYAGQAKMVVKNGKFRSERLTYRGKPLTPGRYMIEISMSAAAFNPPNVQAVVGSRGEKMIGQWVTRGAIDEREFLYKALVDLAEPAVKSAAATAPPRNPYLENAVIERCDQSVDMWGAARGEVYRGEQRREKVRECIRTAVPEGAQYVIERYDNEY